MKRLHVSGVVLLIIAAIAVTACSQAAAPANPTKAPAAAAPAAAAQPTAASAAAAKPAATPAQTVDFPAKGKSIQFICSSAAGSGADLSYRMLFGFAEKTLGTSIEVITKTGAGTQLGAQAIVDAKPDGYTLGSIPQPTTIGLYLDPQRKAPFSRQSFTPIFTHVFDTGATAVKADSPYKTMKDLLDAAKAKPGKVRIGASARGGRQHLDVLQLQQMSGVQFAVVHASSDANPIAMMLGGNLDAVQESVADFLPFVKSGEVRILGVWDSKPSELAPSAPTMESQGFNVYSGVTRVIAGPAGIPKPIVDALAAGFKKAVDDPAQMQKAKEMGLVVRWSGPEETAATWAKDEERIKTLMPLVTDTN